MNWFTSVELQYPSGTNWDSKPYPWFWQHDNDKWIDIFSKYFIGFECLKVSSVDELKSKWDEIGDDKYKILQFQLHNFDGEWLKKDVFKIIKNIHSSNLNYNKILYIIDVRQESSMDWYVVHDFLIKIKKETSLTDNNFLFVDSNVGDIKVDKNINYYCFPGWAIKIYFYTKLLNDNKSLECIFNYSFRYQRKNKFTYMNYMPHYHKVYILWKIYKSNLLKDGMVSFPKFLTFDFWDESDAHGTSTDSLHPSLPLSKNIPAWEFFDQSMLKELYEQLPLLIDTSDDFRDVRKVDDYNHNSDLYTPYLISQIIIGINPLISLDTYVDLCGETRYSGAHVILTEKSFKPFIGMNFPIFFSQPGVTDYFKRAGFFVFDNIIDISYDVDYDDTEDKFVSTLDHKYLDRVFDSFKNFVSLPIGDIHSLFVKNKEKLIYNHNYFYNDYVPNLLRGYLYSIEKIITGDKNDIQN